MENGFHERLKVFLWKIVSGVIPSKDVLARRIKGLIHTNIKSKSKSKCEGETKDK